MENKSNIDEILKEGYEHLENGELEKAIGTYEKGLKTNSDSPALLNNLAQAYALAGEIKKSRQCNLKLIELCENDNTPETLMIKANSLMNINSLTEALETYEKIINYNPKNIPALFQISAIYKEKEDYKRSNRYLNRILDEDGENVVALIEKGTNYSKMKDYESAKKCYDKVLEISPKHEMAIRLKGELLSETGNRHDLKEHINRILKIKPDSPYTLMLKAMELANENNDKKAIEFFNRAISVDPMLDEAYFNKAGFLMLKKRYDEAIACYRQAFEINPESGGITDKEGLFELLHQMRNADQH